MSDPRRRPESYEERLRKRPVHPKECPACRRWKRWCECEEEDSLGARRGG